MHRWTGDSDSSSAWFIPTSWFRSSSPCRLHAQKSSATAIMCFDPEAQKLSCCFNCERNIKIHKGTQDLQAWAKPLRETVYICLYQSYIYSVYAIVCYCLLLSIAYFHNSHCPLPPIWAKPWWSLMHSGGQKEIAAPAKRANRAGKALDCETLRDIARQNTSKIIKIVWHKPDPIHIIHACYIFHFAYLCVVLSRIS